MLRITAGPGTEDYSSIQEALDAVPYNTPAEILVSPGVYRERLFSDKHDLVLRGLGDVTVTFSQGGYDPGLRHKRGTFRSATAFFSGERLVLENLRIVNEADPSRGQALALYLDVDTAELSSITLESFQDTLFLAPLPDEEREKGGFYGPRHLLPRKRNRTVISDSSIAGTVDFIFGGGDALFERCQIISRGSGYVTAPSGKRDWLGFVFHGCRFAGTGHSYLMRPWRPEGKASFLSCSFGSHLDPALFISWPGHEAEAGQSGFFLHDSGTPDNMSGEDALLLLSAFRH